MSIGLMAVRSDFENPPSSAAKTYNNKSLTTSDSSITEPNRLDFKSARLRQSGSSYPQAVSAREISLSSVTKRRDDRSPAASRSTSRNQAESPAPVFTPFSFVLPPFLVAGPRSKI